MNLLFKLFYDEVTSTYHRVLHTELASGKCYVITLKKDGKYLSGPHEFDLNLFIEQSKKFELQSIDPFVKFVKEESISPSDRKIRDRRYLDIGPIVTSKPNCYNQSWVRTRVLDLLHSNEHLTRYKIYSAIQAYQASGESKNSLLPNYKNCGGAGKERKVKTVRLGRNPQYESGSEMILSESDKEIIKKSWWKFRVKKSSNSDYAAYTELISRYYKSLDKYPSIGQFTYWGKKLNDPRLAKKEIVGNIKFQKDYETLSGSAREMSFGPGCEAQLDNTIDDTHVLSMVIENTFIGRLTLFLLVDTFSAMPMGIALVPDNASYTTTSLVIINAATDKVEFCKELDIPISPQDWPVKHLPVKILSDQGLLLGPIANSVVNNLRIQVDNCPSYRPDLKPIVERHIGKLLHKISGLLQGKGLVNKKDSPRIITDTRLEATLNYVDLLKIMVKEILFFIKYEEIKDYPLSYDMELAGLVPTSLNLWNFGVEQGLASLLEEPIEELRIKLLTSKPYSYNKAGILFYNKRWLPVDESGLAAFNKIRFGNGPDKIDVSYSLIDTNQVYFSYENKFHKLKPVHKDVHARTFSELERSRLRRVAQNKINGHNKLLAAIEKREFQNGVLRDANARKKAHGKVNIRDARAAKNIDKEHYRNIGPFSQKTNLSTEVASIATPKDPLSMPDFLNEITNYGK
ncbi:MAG: hypothetical protein JST37_10465 [Bacteroidetes bacterium]|nr:hypothetical protein [Bacteroidota bacterium]